MKKSEWQPWIDIVDSDLLYNYSLLEGDQGNYVDKIDVVDALELVPEKYLQIYALALSVAKWHPNRLPERRGCGTCGLCCINRWAGDYVCQECPLYQAGYHCLDSDKTTLFEKACSGLDEDPPDTKYADKLYHVLLRLYTEEFKRIFKEV